MKSKRILSILALTSVLAFSGCSSTPTDAGVTTTSVEVTTAKIGEIETNYIYSGKAVPVEEATVFSMVAGLVKTVNVEIGDTVQAGDILFEMDVASLQTTLKGLQASYQAALAGAETSKLALDSVNGAQTQIAVENSRIALETAKTAYDNAVIMHQNGFVADEALKTAEDAYNQAKQSYELTSVDLIEENTEKAQAGLNVANAQAQSVAAQIEATRKSIADAKVESPISGVVTGLNAMEGVLLSSAAVPVTISDMSSVIVKVSVSEQTINSLTKGQDVSVKIGAVSNNLMTGKIKTINPAANMAGTYDVEIEISNISGIVKSGMFAEVIFGKEKGYNSIVVDRDAVITKNNEEYVFVAQDGVAVKRIVILGVDDGSQVQILKGVEEGDTIIVKGQKFLNDGDLLYIVAVDGVKDETPDVKGE